MQNVLPPFLFAILVVTMCALCWLLGTPHNLHDPYNLIFGLPIVYLGINLAHLGSKTFKKVKTNILTFNKPDKLVTEGPFKFSRNPMYLGFVIAMIGFAIVFYAGISSFIIAALFFIITDRWYIKYEEDMMTKTFGEDYQKYCKKTRRWL